MKKLLCAVLASAAFVYAQPAIAPPQAGWVTYQDQDGGRLRPVLGMAANFILGDPLNSGVVSVAFSGAFGIVKTDSSILVLDRNAQPVFQMNAEDGPALFAFLNDGTPALVYLPQSQTLLAWRADHLEPTTFDASRINGAVLAISSPTRDRLSLIVKREDGLWRMDMDSGAQTFLPGVSEPVLLLADGSLLYTDSQQFVLRQADGTERRIDGAVTTATFEQMGNGWVHISEKDSARHFTVRLDYGREQVYQLPEVAQ